MLLAALVLALPGDGLLLHFPTGGEIVYVETFRVSTKSATSTISGEAERTVRLRVKETSRGRTRFAVTFSDLAVKQGNTGINDDMRTWLESSDFEQWVNERGYVERKAEPKGNRPFFGLVLPPPGNDLPDRWTAKLLPPIGSDRAVEFEYRLDAQSVTKDVLNVAVSAKTKEQGTAMEVSGRVVVTPNGEVRFGSLTTTLDDTIEKTLTTIDYRFRKE